MFAPGAITCEYSTSRSVSPAQPARLLVGWYGATLPAGWMIFSEGGAGRPNFLSNTARSWRTVGEPKESTMTIVAPLPVMPFLNRGFRL